MTEDIGMEGIEEEIDDESDIDTIGSESDDNEDSDNESVVSPLLEDGAPRKLLTSTQHQFVQDHLLEDTEDLWLPALPFLALYSSINVSVPILIEKYVNVIEKYMMATRISEDEALSASDKVQYLVEKVSDCFRLIQNDADFDDLFSEITSWDAKRVIALGLLKGSKSIVFRQLPFDKWSGKESITALTAQSDFFCRLLNERKDDSSKWSLLSIYLETEIVNAIIDRKVTFTDICADTFWLKAR